MTKPNQGVILCGGLGTRLRPITETIPKPMIMCNGKPFLWYLLTQLHDQGIKRFLLLTGYLSEKIVDYFGDGSTWGWEIEYSEGLVEWDTGKRIWEAKENLDDCFLLLYSDNFVTYSLDKAFNFHKKSETPLTFLVASKIFGNIHLDPKGIVEKYDNTRSKDKFNHVEIGYMIIEKKQMLSFFEKPECSFNFVLQKMIANRQISAMIYHNDYYSISEVKRWRKTEAYLKPKKIILIDRDGILNKRAAQGQYITRWEDFEWIPETYETMILLAKKGFQFIVITNQAGVSRGMIDPNQLERIHQNMQEELLNDGIEILKIYVCPHHWDDNCDCRKPQPGMFYQASRDWLLRLDKTLYVGDDPRDCKAACNASCDSIFIGESSELKKLSDHEHPIFVGHQMSDAVPTILKTFKGNNMP